MTAAAAHVTVALSNFGVGAWDLGSFLTNTLSKVKTWGGQGLMIIGAAMLVFTGVKLWNKIYGSPQKAQETGWPKIAIGVLIGGALLGSGFTIMQQVSSGGSQTIRELGGGQVVISQDVPHLGGGSVLIESE